MIIREDKRFNEVVYIMKLKNGMQVHMLPKDDPYFSTYVELSMPFGANHLHYKLDDHEVHYPPGSAHFMEHKIFAMPYGDAFMKFSNLGVDANAMTSYQQTSYMFNATSNVIEALKLLLEMLDTPYFTKENIETEYQIISEELKMYLDDIDSVIYQDLMAALYQNHPFKNDIGGTLDSIKHIDKNVLNDIFSHFYHPSNRLIVIAGKIDIKEIEAFFKAYDRKIKTDIPKIKYPREPKQVFKENVVKVKDLSISKLALGFKFKSNNKRGIDQIKNELMHTMLFNLLIGPSSDLYHDLLSKKLINKNFYISSAFENKDAHFMIFADTKDPETLKTKLLNYLQQSDKPLFTKEAFERYIKVYLGQFIFALNSVEHKAYLYGKYIHKHAHLFDVVDAIQSITFEDLLETYEQFKNYPVASVMYKKG